MILFLVAVKLAVDELAARLANGFLSDYGELVAVHQVHDFREALDKRRADGLELRAVREDDRENGLFLVTVLSVLNVGVERVRLDFVTLAGLDVFDVDAAALGELVQGFLVGAEVLDVGADDFHFFLSFLACHLQER